MALRPDRIAELLEGRKRIRKEIVSPEGVVLDVEIADNWTRFGAFTLDFLFWMLATLGVYILAILMLFAFKSEKSVLIGMTVFTLLAFLLRNLYFIHFELAWQGRSPGKLICGLRVIDRSGGPLTPSAIIARNLTREVEVFLPLSFYINFQATSGIGAWQQLALLGWVLIISALPLFNREHLRGGDLIGGTLVIAMPKHILLEDLSKTAANFLFPGEQGYQFTRQQLGAYGAFELQVLEEMLRRPPGAETTKLLEQVCIKICNKIAWNEPVPLSDTRQFLAAFYAAERGELEREQLFGRYRADKTQTNVVATPVRPWEALQSKAPKKL